jgi:peptidoglycan hydrolase-like protein with peptidoglycan-binding domain
MLPLALFVLAGLGIALASSSKAASLPPVPPLPGTAPSVPVPATPATAAPVSALPPAIQEQLAQAIASRDPAKIAAAAAVIAPQFPAAAQELTQAAQNLGVPVPATPAAKVGPTPEEDASIRAQIFKATDPVALENLAAVMSKRAGFDSLVQLAMSRAVELRAMLATANAAQQVQAITNAAAPSLVATSNPMLQRGKTGGLEKFVKVWQRIIGVKDDGVFGSGTESATKQWQAAHGVKPADGIVGPKTWARAAELAAASKPPMAPPVVTSNPPPSQSPGLPTSGISTAVPAPSITAPTAPAVVPLTDLQIETAAVAKHIKGLKRGSEDKTIIKNWQVRAGVASPDGLFGAGSAERMAELGIGDLPIVWYWPKDVKTAQKRVGTYKSRLRELANQAEAKGNTALATQLRMSADRDNGQGVQVGF